MTTIVFGGAGFVGLNIAETLLQRGVDVVICDLTPPPDEAVDQLGAATGDLRVVTGDILDPATVRAAFDGGGENVVFGAAVTSGARREATAPERVLEVNLMGFLGVLRAARKAKTRRVINLSSAGAYGGAATGDIPLDEEATCADPVSLYSMTKFGSERIGARLGDLWGMDVRSVRLSAVFGRWERITSVRDTPSPQYQAMQLALAGKPALFDREGWRDWTYGPDIAAAIAALLEADRLRHPLYNVSCGVVSSALAWAQLLAERLTGFEARLCHEGETPTIDLHTTTDRPPLATDRLTGDIDIEAAYDTAASASDYLAHVGRQSTMRVG